jgi:hypothetical protein
MKVLNLRCANGHGFEGWFASESDFLDQNGRGLIECPLCADHAVTRLPSAPRLNLSVAKQGPSVVAEPGAPGSVPAVAAQPADLQAAWLQAVRQLMAKTEDVGERFSEEARRIHYGETPQRAIRGQASEAQREALHDEGIEVVSIPLPRALKGSVQ